MNAKQVKESFSIIHFLYRIGFAPEKIKGPDHWYLSPIRENERTASFKAREKVWYDHGLGVGGNIIDLGLLLFKTKDLSLVLQKITDVFSSFPQEKMNLTIICTKQTTPKLEVIETKQLHCHSLISYLKERGISKEVGLMYCRQYLYKNVGKEFISIGFPNISGGVELRSPKFKSCIAPKNYSYLKNEGTHLVIFEGFFDFLSYQMLPQIHIEDSDFVVLNSLALVSRVYPLLQSYDKVYLFLDNDQAGREAVHGFKLNHSKVLDMSSLYPKNNDLNEYLMIKL